MMTGSLITEPMGSGEVLSSVSAFEAEAEEAGAAVDDEAWFCEDAAASDEAFDEADEG